jgi:UDP-glucose 4-epimerase
VDALLADGETVRVLDDFSSGNLANLPKDRIELIRGSVADAEMVRDAVAGCDVVYHLAAIASVTKSVEAPVTTHEVCATGTLHVLDEARKAGVRRVIYAGSSSAYGDQPGDARRENDLLMPLSPYAAAKLAGEHYCSAFTSAYGLETVRLRFFNVYGPRQDAKSPYSGVIAIFSDMMKRGQTPTIFGDGKQARDFIYVADVVTAIRLAAGAKKASGQVYNIGTGQSITVLDLVRTLNEILKTKIQPIHAAPRAGDVRISQADIRLAREELNFEPGVSFHDGLTRTLK